METPAHRAAVREAARLNRSGRQLLDELTSGVPGALGAPEVLEAIRRLGHSFDRQESAMAREHLPELRTALELGERIFLRIGELLARGGTAYGGAAASGGVEARREGEALGQQLARHRAMLIRAAAAGDAVARALLLG